MAGRGLAAFPLERPLSRRLTGRHRFRIQSRRIQPRHVPHCWHVAAGRIAPPSSADRRRTPPRPARTRNPQSQPPTRPRRRKTRDRCSRACPTLVPNLTDSMSKLMSPPRRSRQRHPPPGLVVSGLGACMSSLRTSLRSRPERPNFLPSPLRSPPPRALFGARAADRSRGEPRK